DVGTRTDTGPGRHRAAPAASAGVLGLDVLIEDPHWREHRGWAMGSPSHLIVGGGDEPLVEWAVGELERLEQCWSRFRPDSELSQLVARAGTWVSISTELLGALTRARQLWERTAGAFDPTVGAALRSLGYDRSFSAIDRSDAGPWSAPAPAPGFAAVELDEDRSAARAPEGTELDLGGLGKGLAADWVTEGLVERGAAAALVGLGGDIRTAGTVPDGGWVIPVLDPFAGEVVWREEVLAAEAVVTSTSLIRSWTRGGRTVHHILDPLTGQPSDTGVAAVVARGRQAWWAEGLAKAAMIVGEACAPSMLHGTGVSAVLFRTDGSTTEVGDAEALCSPS
ncbi:MAG: FAD:protein FMN transferase, partial [Acidimicrobiales bacterium]